MTDTPQSILLIDDLQQRKVTLSSRLRMLGFTIDIATGGFHGIHLLEKNHYNLVLLIDDMDDMAAHETISLIRACRRSSHTPVVVMRSPGNELDEDMLNFIKLEKASEICPWKDEFKTVLQQINRHIA